MHPNTHSEAHSGVHSGALWIDALERRVREVHVMAAVGGRWTSLMLSHIEERGYTAVSLELGLGLGFDLGLPLVL